MRKYDDFFKIVADFTKKRKLQKLRGINDYNIVNIVRKENAEVGMHSNVIASLIDPNGLHYQGDLFLQLFVKDVLDINDLGEVISVQAEEVTSDTRRIDFTIKSTNYYIGIEMKVDAYDLQNQISHYYEDLQLKAKEDNNQKVLIYYLTKNGKEASIESHNNIPYKRVSFSNHILNWLNNSQQEVKNITNLNEALENYKDIVKKITNQHRSKIMNLEDYLSQNKSISQEQLIEIFDEIDAIQNSVKNNFFNKLENVLSDIELHKDGDCIDINLKSFFIRIININSILTIQIGDRNDPGFQRKVEQELKANVLNKLRQVNKNFKSGWSNSLGVLEIGKISFQTQNNLLNAVPTLILNIKNELLTLE